MERKRCTICLSSNMELVVHLKNYPIKYIAPKESSEPDILIDHDLLGCKECGCVQLKNLVDPKLLYDTPHNSPTSEVWKIHHDLFAQFIKNNLATNDTIKIVEIGGYIGLLAEKMNQYDNIKYTIFDICEHNPNLPNVDFICGNCETYDFSEDSVIVMSHVFEHLYEPRKFLENMKKNKIRDIFISIPNQTLQMKNNIHPVLYQEHTYLGEFNDIEYIFSQYNYEMKTSYEYGIHALLCHFSLTNKELNIVLKKDTNRIEFIKNQYREKFETTNNLDIPEKFFIIPACFSGQLIYHNIKSEYKNNLLGFLDNDPTKTGQRFYGTSKYVYRMDEVRNHIGRLKILIHKGAYVNEIVKQLNSYKSDIDFVYI